MPRSILLLAAFLLAAAAPAPPTPETRAVAEALAKRVLAISGPVRIPRERVEAAFVDSLLHVWRTTRPPLCDPQIPECTRRTKKVVASSVDRFVREAPARAERNLPDVLITMAPDLVAVEKELARASSDEPEARAQARTVANYLVTMAAGFGLQREIERMWPEVDKATARLPRRSPLTVPRPAPPPPPLAPSPPN